MMINVIDDIMYGLSYKLNKQLEDYMIEGLKRKGFYFENRVELENFIGNDIPVYTK